MTMSKESSGKSSWVMSISRKVRSGYFSLMLATHTALMSMLVMSQYPDAARWRDRSELPQPSCRIRAEGPNLGYKY